MCVSCLVMSDSVTPWTVAHQAPLSMGFSRQQYWSELHFILQGIFLTQGLNPCLLHFRQILYHLSYKEVFQYVYNCFGKNQNKNEDWEYGSVHGESFSFK